MKFSWAVSTPIANVLLIHATGNVEMGLVAKEHERVRRQDFQERFTSCLASVKITFSELLHYYHFVWIIPFSTTIESHVTIESHNFTPPRRISAPATNISTTNETQIFVYENSTIRRTKLHFKYPPPTPSHGKLTQSNMREYGTNIVK